MKKTFDYLKKFYPTPANILKISVVVFLVVLIIAFSFSLLGSYFKSATLGLGGGASFPSIAPVPGYNPGAPELTVRESADYSYEIGRGSVDAYGGNMPPPIKPPFPYPGGVTGDDAEEFEVTEYYATVETQSLKEACEVISGLKSKSYIIFENASEYEKGCNYTFKVRQGNVSDVLAVIESLNPKSLTENVYTIKKVLEEFAREEDILLHKQRTIEETLRSAILAYDDLTNLAVRTENVETLAKIVESKLQTIERLTQENLKISQRLEVLGHAQAEQSDKLEYTYFYAVIFENKYVDLENLRDSWKETVRKFVFDVNRILQDISVNLVILVLVLAQYAIYLLILVVVAKYGWQIVKKIWEK